MESTSECSPIQLDIQRDIGDDYSSLMLVKKFGYLKKSITTGYVYYVTVPMKRALNAGVIKINLIT